MRAVKVVYQGKGVSSIRLDPEILKMARAAAADRQISLGEIIEEALQDYLLVEH
jgi:predicted HicB family RNase H-like nuclease